MPPSRTKLAPPSNILYLIMAGSAHNTTLFEDFKKISAEEWKAKIIKDLKGADFQEKLVWRTYEGIDIQPFYTAEDIREQRCSDQIHSLQSSSNWHYREEIVVKDADTANKQAIEALSKGADAIAFDLTTVSLAELSYPKLMAGINPNQAPVTFKTTEASLLLQQIKQNNPSLSALKGSLDFDPLAQWMQTGASYQEKMQALLATHQAFAASQAFTAITVNSHHFHNAGASAVQELAFTLSSALAYVDYLTDQQQAPQEIFTNIEFSVSSGTNYFFEIAKLRALRWLWAKLAASYAVSLQTLKIHASTSYWSKTAADPYVNILRNTTEAMAALAGGSSSLTVLPYDVAINNEPDDFSRRISRNISVILKEESYFDKTIDPAAGSYYIEKLSDSLVEASWELFLQVEKMGGIAKAFEKGFVQQEIEKVRQQKAVNLQTGKETLVGTNKYINKGEETIRPLTAPLVEEKGGLRLLRPYHAFELIQS